MSRKQLLQLFALVACLLCSMSAAAAATAEAYVVYSPSNKKLTFYYDIYRNTRLGRIYNIDPEAADPAWMVDGISSSVTAVIFDPSFTFYRPTTTCEWFCDMENLQSIANIQYLHTEQVTDMCAMFAHCKKLNSVDLSHFNTANVVDMSSMFWNCRSLSYLYLESFNTSKVKNMGEMFNTCSDLRAIYVGDGWNTAAVIESSRMFFSCNQLVGGWGTTYDANHVDKTYARIDGGPTQPGYLAPKGTEAYACYTSSDKTLTFYYDNARSYRSGTTYNMNSGNNFPDWNDSDGPYRDVRRVVFHLSFVGFRPSTTFQWFYKMGNLQSIEGIRNLNTSLVSNMNSMFRGCSSLQQLDLSGFNTSTVQSMGSMFEDCTNLTTIKVGSGWTTAAIQNNWSNNMFLNCKKLRGVLGTTYNPNYVDKTRAHIDGGPSNPGYLTDNNDPYVCYMSASSTLTFYYDDKKNSRSGRIYDIDPEDADPAWMVDGISADVTKVVFDPSFENYRPTNTCEWFCDMENLQSITGIHYLHTELVTDMSAMFAHCKSLSSLDLSHFNTTRVADMSSMFWNCRGLTSLDLSGFLTANVVNMSYMFEDCKGLRSLDLTGFDTNVVRKMDGMFKGCYNLITVYAGYYWITDFVNSSVDMFLNCTMIKGGKGTTYSSSYTDKTRARIDGGSALPGYFTQGVVPYAVHTDSNKTMTFYYDNKCGTRSGTVYYINPSADEQSWYDRTVSAEMTRVVFDASFASYRPVSTYCWFYGAANLQTIEGIRNLNTEQVEDMHGMFRGCSRLTSLDLSSFNTSNVVSMSCMFDDCSNLTSLDMSGWNTPKLMFTYSMFEGCSKLTTIYAGGGWNTGAVTSSADMFLNCTRLKGGKGTTYNANYVDKTRAHIDGGTSYPGYFTSGGLRGDENGDGEVTVADINFLVNMILSNNGSSVGDVNGDGEVGIADINTLVDIILNN